MAADQTLDALMDPSRYIEKVNLGTGEHIDEPILPEQLLVQSHRDYHVVDVYARYVMSWLVDATGNESLVREAMKEVRKIGHRASEALAHAIGVQDHEKISSALFGLKDREYYFRYKKDLLSSEELANRIFRLKETARRKLDAVKKDGQPRVTVLLTGGTGFVGKEILWQAAKDPTIEQMIVLIRPQKIRDRETGEVTKVLSPVERGRQLLAQLWLEVPEAEGKFRFMAGDIEKPRFGLGEPELEQLRTTVTHVIHCAASVAFDDPYEASFKANVLGSLNALELSHELQSAEGSPFVAHLSIETSYIHGRQSHHVAREDEIVFPRNFYNNYYELTKAMASIETEHFMMEKGLRVVQLCPSIVVGDARTGNNRGDLKVVNAPVNAFGRIEETLAGPEGTHTKTQLLARMASMFPGNATAQLNLIPVDRVAEGILAALTHVEAVGERIHLATDRRISAKDMCRILEEELHIHVHLSEPTLHRTVSLPMMTALLTGLRQNKLAGALEKLANIFGGYSEWGQTVHQVGNDVQVLGLSDVRPDTQQIFRMLCRHNKHVQHFGRIRDLDELSRREKVWIDFLADLERLAGRPAGTLTPDEFQAAVELAIDGEAFERRHPLE